MQGTTRPKPDGKARQDPIWRWGEGFLIRGVNPSRSKTRERDVLQDLIMREMPRISILSKTKRLRDKSRARFPSNSFRDRGTTQRQVKGRSGGIDFTRG